MNKATIKRLKSNPHYKLSEKQENIIYEANQSNSTIGYDKPEIHSTNINIHPVVKRKRRKRKEVSEDSAE